MYVINLKIAKAIKENEEKDYEAFKTKIEKLTDEKREIYKGNQEIINKVLNVYLEEIKKHSKDILDLIEPGDVLEIEEDGDIFYIGIKKDSTTFSYSDIKESIRNKEVKLLRVLTHEQFEENSFEVV